MRDAIENASYLQPFRSYSCSDIIGKSRLCRNQNSTYSVSGASFGSPTYNWTVTSGLQINGSSTSSTVNIYRNPTASTSSGTITLTINGTIIKTKKIRTFCFFGIGKPIGVYDWVSKDYGNMGLVIPVNPDDADQDDPVVSYLWEINENPNSISTNSNNNDIKPFFFGATSTEPNIFFSSTNQAVVNWGNSSSSYLLTCKETTASGEEYLVSENYVDVGETTNNPCHIDAVQSIIAPNPVINGQVNVVIIKPENAAPCNYKNPEQAQFFNSEIDNINNSITIFDYNGNQIYSNVFDTNEFTIDGLNLISGNNYVVNLFTNEGGFRQQVIIAE